MMMMMMHTHCFIIVRCRSFVDVVAAAAHSELLEAIRNTDFTRKMIFSTSEKKWT